MTQSRLTPVINKIIKVLNECDLNSDEVLAVIAILGPIVADTLGIDIEEAYDRAMCVVREENRKAVANDLAIS
jgi:hypothetical protein